MSEYAASEQRIVPPREILRSITRVQVFTIIWMTGEGAVSLVSAWRAHSPALFAFGGDSFIELISAVVVFLRFRPGANAEKRERQAAIIAGALLIALAVCVGLTSTLSLLGSREARPSFVGIGLLCAAAFVMPFLGRRKRQLAEMASSASLRADAAESSLCGYMAWIALAGLAVNALWSKSWTDPVAALALVPIMVREGLEAIRQPGIGCRC